MNLHWKEAFTLGVQVLLWRKTHCLDFIVPLLLFHEDVSWSLIHLAIIVKLCVLDYSKLWLLVDVQFLCYRCDHVAFSSTRCWPTVERAWTLTFCMDSVKTPLLPTTGSTFIVSVFAYGLQQEWVKLWTWVMIWKPGSFFKSIVCCFSWIFYKRVWINMGNFWVIGFLEASLFLFLTMYPAAVPDLKMSFFPH